MASVSPSREFMVRQAVLNAVWNEYPTLLKTSGSIASVLRFFVYSIGIPGNLIVAITNEFHKLQQRYERAA
jgi:hypothetical protein